MSPLAKGSGKKTIASNVKEMMERYHATGRIGNTTPRSPEHAMRIAVAAAYHKAGRGKSGKK